MVHACTKPGYAIASRLFIQRHTWKATVWHTQSAKLVCVETTSYYCKGNNSRLIQTIKYVQYHTHTHTHTHTLTHMHCTYANTHTHTHTCTTHMHTHTHTHTHTHSLRAHTHTHTHTCTHTHCVRTHTHTHMQFIYTGE